MNKKLTLSDLEKMDEVIFAKGFGLIDHPWHHDAKKTLEKDGISTKVKWVAKKIGSTYGWCIYHSMCTAFTHADYFDDPEHLKASFEMIIKYGAKLTQEHRIKDLVPCTDEAFEKYEY